MKINYDEAAKTYDSTRKSDKSLIEIFDQNNLLSIGKNILDFGCGTGNYLYDLTRDYQGNYFGIDPSEEMRRIAQYKCPEAIIKDGNHINIPFDNSFFDFIFMTDVIHHIPDIACLFSSLYTKLKIDSLVCILTSSHKQIEIRWYNEYFPSLRTNEKKRYPDIEEILINAQNNGFSKNAIELMNYGNKNIITEEFIQMVEEKNYSMFRLLDEEEYKAGLKKMKNDKGKVIVGQPHGETLVWLIKKRLTTVST